MAETRPKWVNALDPTFRAIYNETDNTFQAMYDRIFHVQNSTKAFEKDTALSGIGQLEEVPELGAIPYEDATPGWDVTYVHRKFAKGRMVSQEMIDDEKFNMIQKLPKSLANAKNRTKEQAAADIFNYGFVAGGGGLAKFAGGDAQALFSTTHVNRQGTITQSNKITTALSQTSLQAVVTAMKTRRDSKGQIISFTPKTLIVPSALEFTARTILETTQVLGSNNNDINPIKGALNLVVWPFLTSTTAWFVIDDDAHELNFFNRKDEGVKGPSWDFDNEAAKWKIVARWSVGFSDWMGVYGSVGDNS
jgi:phage major head subunit gpT-like protein